MNDSSPVRRPTTPVRKLATPAEVAEWLQVPEDRLRKLRQTKRGPVFIKIEGRVRYAWGDVHAWVESLRSSSTATYADDAKA